MEYYEDQENLFTNLQNMPPETTRMEKIDLVLDRDNERMMEYIKTTKDIKCLLPHNYLEVMGRENNTRLYSRLSGSKYIKNKNFTKEEFDCIFSFLKLYICNYTDIPNLYNIYVSDLDFFYTPRLFINHIHDIIKYIIEYDNSRKYEYNKYLPRFKYCYSITTLNVDSSKESILVIYKKINILLSASNFKWDVQETMKIYNEVTSDRTYFEISEAIDIHKIELLLILKGIRISFKTDLKIRKSEIEEFNKEKLKLYQALANCFNLLK